jgi:hypothetical protein
MAASLYETMNREKKMSTTNNLTPQDKEIMVAPHFRRVFTLITGKVFCIACGSYICFPVWRKSPLSEDENENIFPAGFDRGNRRQFT